MFSKACEYAIRATIFIVRESEQGRRVNLTAIATAIDSPEAFTAKILQQLARASVVESVKGPNGGFQVAVEQARQLRLSHVIAAIDGDQIYTGCGLGLAECNADQPCPLHDKFVKIRGELKQMLERTTISEMAMGLTSSLTFLKR
jgi:Rrf2 family protein